jgi:voltage-gated potassium channel Kch
VHRLLTDRGADVTVVDLNLETVRELRDRGAKAFYGDVLRRGTLDEAGIATASSLVLSADVEEAAEIVRQARLHNPNLRVSPGARTCGMRRRCAARARAWWRPAKPRWGSLSPRR